MCNFDFDKFLLEMLKFGIYNWKYIFYCYCSPDICTVPLISVSNAAVFNLEMIDNLFYLFEANYSEKGFVEGGRKEEEVSVGGSSTPEGVQKWVHTPPTLPTG